MTIVSRGLAVVLAAALTGCGGSGDVAGKVTFNGKPVAIGSVVILGSDSLPYTAALEESGEFLVKNVPTGPAKLAVVSRRPHEIKAVRKAERVKPAPAAISADKWFFIPERFEDPLKSGFAFDVRRGENRYDIPLVDAGKK